MWNLIKKAFAMGFGGSLGWQLGSFVGRIIGRILKWITLGLGSMIAVYGAAHMPDLPSTHKAPVAHAAQHAAQHK